MWRILAIVAAVCLVLGVAGVAIPVIKAQAQRDAAKKVHAEAVAKEKTNCKALGQSFVAGKTCVKIAPAASPTPTTHLGDGVPASPAASVAVASSSSSSGSVASHSAGVTAQTGSSSASSSAVTKSSTLSNSTAPTASATCALHSDAGSGETIVGSNPLVQPQGCGGTSVATSAGGL